MQEWVPILGELVRNKLVVCTAAGFLVGILLSVFVFRKTIRRKFSRDETNRLDQFINLASHYMVTPISIIQTALNQLIETDPTSTSEQRYKLYDAIGAGQRRLSILTNNMVLADEIERGKFQLRQSAVDLADCVTAAIADTDVFAKQKEITVSFKSVAEGSTEGKFDLRRLKQAFIALLDNAIKFSEKGTTVEVILSSSQQEFVIEVVDKGIGMSSDVLAHLGERFYRGSSLYTFDYEGIGLGTFIALAILHAHQGELEYRSQSKKGTVAVVSLPRFS